MPAISAFLPEQTSTAARIAPRPRPLAARHRHRRVVAGGDQRRARVERPLRRRAGSCSRIRASRRRRPPPPRSAPRSRPAAALRPRPARAAARSRAPAPPPPGPAASAASRAGDDPGGDDPLRPDLDPHPAQPLGVLRGPFARVVGDEDDLLARREHRRQRLRRARHRLAPEPDDPVEVDQETVVVIASSARPPSVLSAAMRRALALFSVVLAALAVAAAPAGAAKPRHGLGFELHAGGFWVTAKSPLGSERVRLMLDRHGEVAYYWAPARIGADSVRVRFGRLGTLAFRFTPDRSEGPLGCGGRHDGSQRGTFRGTLVFHGENDYADVDAHRARGYMQTRPTECAGKGRSSAGKGKCGGRPHGGAPPARAPRRAPPPRRSPKPAPSSKRRPPTCCPPTSSTPSSTTGRRASASSSARSARNGGKGCGSNAAPRSTAAPPASSGTSAPGRRCSNRRPLRRPRRLQARSARQGELDRLAARPGPRRQAPDAPRRRRLHRPLGRRQLSAPRDLRIIRRCPVVSSAPERSSRASWRSHSFRPGGVGCRRRRIPAPRRDPDARRRLQRRDRRQRSRRQAGRGPDRRPSPSVRRVRRPGGIHRLDRQGAVRRARRTRLQLRAEGPADAECFGAGGSEAAFTGTFTFTGENGYHPHRRRQCHGLYGVDPEPSALSAQRCEHRARRPRARAPSEPYVGDGATLTAIARAKTTKGAVDHGPSPSPAKRTVKNGVRLRPCSRKTMTKG